MTRSFVLGLALAALAGAASAQPDQDQIARGHDLARRNCGMCHAIGPDGASPNKVAPPFRTLSDRYPVDDLQEALAEGILTGHPAMPQFRFSPDAINDLIAYLKSIQVKGHAALETARRPRAG